MQRHKLLLNILSSIATAVIAIILPLQFVDLIKAEHYSVIYLMTSAVLLVDFFNNVIEYRQQITNKIQREILTQTHTPFLLVVDILGILPFGLWVSPIYALIQLLKIIRIGQYQSLWNKKAVRLGDYQKLLFFVFWTIIITHWLACGWLALYTFPGIDDPLTLYIKSLYWSVVTITTVGYGDIVPLTNLQTVYSMLVMVFGIGVYGYLIGNIANILSSSDPAKMAFQKNMDSLKAFVKYRKIPLSLQVRVRDYYAYLWKKRLGYDESDFLMNLPTGLKNELELHLKRKIIDKIPLFKQTGDRFLNDIAMQLKPVIFTPGDFIIRQGEDGQEMYLVIKGHISIFKNESPTNNVVLSDGSFVGEISLLKNEPRSANVQALTYTDMYKLERSIFETVLANHPGIAQKIMETAEARIEMNKTE